MGDVEVVLPDAEERTLRKLEEASASLAESTAALAALMPLIQERLLGAAPRPRPKLTVVKDDDA